LFGYVNSISSTITNISPDIAKTAVDISRGKLVGVSYRRSLLTDEFTNTEITEMVFREVNTYFMKEKFKGFDTYRMMLKEDGRWYKYLSSWWVILAIIPIWVVVVHLDEMFKYGRFLLPHLAFIDLHTFLVRQLFDLFDADPLLWGRLFMHDHIRWAKKMKYQFKFGHLRTLALDTRWIEVQGIWSGKNVTLLQPKIDYAWYFFIMLNDIYRFNGFDGHYDFFIKSLFCSSSKYYLIYILTEFISCIFFCLIIFVFVGLFFAFDLNYRYVMYDFKSSLQFIYDYFKTTDLEKMLKIQKDKESKRKSYKFKERFQDFEEELEVHKATVSFIINWKEEQKKKLKK